MIDQKTFNRFAFAPELFRQSLIVDVDGEPKRFGDVMDPWQADDFAALDPGLERAVGRFDDETAPMRVFLERPRGHSKTTDLAVTCLWALCFATRPIRIFAFGADKDQARLLRDAAESIVRLNALWLKYIVTVEQHKLVVTAPGHPAEGSTLVISTSDVGSSYGILPDLIVADELCHWQGDGSLWNSLISSAAKRKNCLVCVISNAGFADSWQWGVRETARTDPAWIFSRQDGPVASWITQNRLDEQKRMLPTVAYLRLWENVWSSGGGDALLPDDIEAAFDDTLQPMTGHESGYSFVAGVDLGLTRDCSAVVTLAIPEGYGKIRLADHKLWRPLPGKKIDLLDVQAYVRHLDGRFGLEHVAFDPWQAEHLAQTLELVSQHRSRSQRRRQWAKPWMRSVPPTSSNLRDQASLVIESFTDHRLAFYPCEPLRRDLLKLRCEEKSYGIRLSSPRDEHGHGDSFSAFAVALLVGNELSKKHTVTAGAVQPTAAFGAMSMSRQNRFQHVLQQARHGGVSEYQAGFAEAMLTQARRF